jgi:hypothetical protein
MLSYMEGLRAPLPEGMQAPLREGLRAPLPEGGAVGLEAAWAGRPADCVVVPVSEAPGLHGLLNDALNVSKINENK